SAGLVLDDDRLPENRLHPQRHEARHRVRRAARRHRHDELDRALREGLGGGWQGKASRESGGEHCEAAEDKFVYVADHRRILAYRRPRSSRGSSYSAASCSCPSRRLSADKSASAASAITVPGGKMA